MRREQRKVTMERKGQCVIFSRIVLLVFMYIIFVTADTTVVFRMQEEKPSDYLVGTILSQYDSGRGPLKFTMMTGNGNHNDLFDLDETSSNLTTKSTIDREAECPFNDNCQITLNIAAQSVETDDFFDVIVLNIIIDDINDNSPKFPSPSLDLQIEESVLTGSGFRLEGARDEDMSEQFSLQKYKIQPKSPGQALPFSISHTKNLDGSSTVKLIVGEKLNREVTDSYQFYVIAEDGGSPPRQGSLLVTVTILDINDNSPVFDQQSYNITVREDIAKDSTVLRLSATDEDIGANGLVSYRLSPLQHEDNLKYFAIGPYTGNLTVIANLALSSKSYFRLFVEATDQGDAPLMSQVLVEVTVLDTSNSPPEITLNLLNKGNSSRISEYANVGAVVAHVAVSDRDTGRNGDVTCSIESDVFSLSKYDNNEYKVTVAMSLDRERVSKHNVSVTCNDKGLPPLSVTSWFSVEIDDENDKAPLFRQQRYFVNMDENNEVGDKIITVSAFDLDAGINKDIEYFIDERSAAYAFVNPHTGDITARKVFDKESPDGDGFSLTVYAKDKGTPSMTGTTSVIVNINDKNDNRPIFEQPLFRFWMEENEKTGTYVGHLLASDNDTGINAVTKFSLKPNGPLIPFDVLEDGRIIVTRELDRETQSQYTFEVMATDAADSTLFSTASVTFFITDTNDNPPKIEYPSDGNNTVQVSHLTPPNSVIYRVIAFDRDEPNTENSKLQYSISTVNSTSFFSINKNTGEVILKAPLENTNSINKMFLLKVTVKDSGLTVQTSTATLYVTIISGNATAAAVVEESSKNFLIVIIVATVTVVISAGIIVTICVIRRLDARRRADKGRQKSLSDTMYAKNTEEVDNIFPLPVDTSYTEKKKKEVSFSLENGGLDQHMNRSIEDETHDAFLLEVSFYKFRSWSVH